MCRSGEETVGFLHRRLTRCEGIHGRDLKTIALTGDDVLQLCVCVYHHQINKMRRLGLSVRPSDTGLSLWHFRGFEYRDARGTEPFESAARHGVPGRPLF